MRCQETRALPAVPRRVWMPPAVAERSAPGRRAGRGLSHMTWPPWWPSLLPLCPGSWAPPPETSSGSQWHNRRSYDPRDDQRAPGRPRSRRAEPRLGAAVFGYGIKRVCSGRGPSDDLPGVGFEKEQTVRRAAEMEGADLGATSPSPLGGLEGEHLGPGGSPAFESTQPHASSGSASAAPEGQEQRLGTPGEASPYPTPAEFGWPPAEVEVTDSSWFLG
jgi:hypothetical protein